MADSSSVERRVTSYPPPKYFRLLMAYAKVNETSESKITTLAVKAFFDNMPESERQRIIHLAENPLPE